MSKKSAKIWNEIYKNSLFIISIIAIILILPTASMDPFQYELGKPWQYNLLTAPYDFPIYKTSNKLYSERQEIENSISYFDYNANILNDKLQQINSFENSLKEGNRFTKEDSIGFNYLKTKLNKIYTIGIVSIKDLNIGYAYKDSTIMLKSNNITTQHYIGSFYTTSTALAEIKKDFPANINANWLTKWKVESFIATNVNYDATTTNMIKTERINNIAISEGMIQAGERIIDKGDIVTEENAKILDSLSKEIISKQGLSFNELSKLFIGRSIIIVCLVLLLYLYLRLFRKQYYQSKRILTLILLLVTSFSVITSLVIQYTSPSVVYIIPFSLLAIIICSFFDTRTALYTSNITIFICSLMVGAPFEFILLQSIVSMTAICVLRDLSQRSQLIKIALIIILTYCVVSFGYSLTSDSNIFEVKWIEYVFFLINGILLLFAYPLIYIIELIFGFISNIKLIELSDINNPLLRKLSENAPGTFQHCTQVSNLAVEIAHKIDANPLLVRVGALYHDIGKINNPAFFTENQAKGINPHNKLTPEESSIIITDHVKEGVKIAKEYRLPKTIIEFIETHHGKSLTKYFYNQYVNEHPDEEVDINKFSYFGPNPYTKEQAIVMACDAVEAASRSLPEYTDESINNLVDKIVNSQINEHYMDRAPITLKELSMIKDILKEKLKNIYHTRVAYPEIKK